MNEQIFFYIGVDPGLSGGYSILAEKNGEIFDAKVFGTPVIKTKATKTSKAKNEYNIEEIAANLKLYQNCNVIACLELVNAMPNQGTVSMFHFGEGYGMWKGILRTLGFKLHLIRPAVWKSFWPDRLLKKIVKPDILKLRTVEINRLSAEGRKNYKDAKKLHKEQVDQAKKLAKDQARELATLLYPNLAESFKLKKDDGKAEAILIAEYIRRNPNVE